MTAKLLSRLSTLLICSCLLLRTTTVPSQASESIDKTAETNQSEKLFGHWLVEEINGQRIIDNAQPTIEIDNDRSVIGSTGINQYTGNATIDGQTLLFKELTSCRQSSQHPTINLSLAKSPNRNVVQVKF